MKLLAQQRDLQVLNIYYHLIWYIIYIQFKTFFYLLLLLLFLCCKFFKAKIPDIEKCLDIVATLQSKKGSGEVCFTIFPNYFMAFYLFLDPEPQRRAVGIPICVMCATNTNEKDSLI